MCLFELPAELATYDTECHLHLNEQQTIIIQTFLKYIKKKESVPNTQLTVFVAQMKTCFLLP